MLLPGGYDLAIHGSFDKLMSPNVQISTDFKKKKEEKQSQSRLNIWGLNEKKNWCVFHVFIYLIIINDIDLLFMIKNRFGIIFFGLHPGRVTFVFVPFVEAFSSWWVFLRFVISPLQRGYIASRWRSEDQRSNLMSWKALEIEQVQKKNKVFWCAF